jgi:hypothetical protein
MNTRLMKSALLAGTACALLVTGCASDNGYAEENRSYRYDNEPTTEPTGTDSTWEMNPKDHRNGSYYRSSRPQEPTGTDDPWQASKPDYRRYEQARPSSSGMTVEPTGTDDPWAIPARR